MLPFLIIDYKLLKRKAKKYRTKKIVVEFLNYATTIQFTTMNIKHVEECCKKKQASWEKEKK